MAIDIDKLAKYCEKFASDVEALEKNAKDKKVDSKAKVRNRGTVVFPAESSSVNDKKDHYPLSSESQARNALARSHQYTSVPPWYNGSLKSLQEAVRRKVHSMYPSIEIAKSNKKVSFLAKKLIEKYGFHTK